MCYIRVSGRYVDDGYRKYNYSTHDPRVWLMDVRCTGSETDLLQCSNEGLGNAHSCEEYRAVAVSCDFFHRKTFHCSL